MKYTKDRITIEFLESRIAPALFFVSGVDLKIRDATGADLPGDTSAATAAGAAKALLLHKGDSLVYDANGDHKVSPGEPVMFIDSAGQSMVFFTDLNSDSKFEPTDFSGLAVGDGFKGTINGVLHGSVATLLRTDGGFDATTIQASSIAGITLNGSIDGSVVAGKNITGIVAKLPPGGNPVALDITRSIFAGNSFNGGSLSLNGDNKSLMPSYTPGDGEAGGNVSKITLPGGVVGIFAGNAGNSATGDGAKGGDILSINLGGSAEATLSAGAGGNATSGVGGPGGNIIGATIKIHFGLIGIAGGQGGSSTNGSGGAGGKISGVTLTVLDDGTEGSITGGQGGDAGGTGTAGAGGAIEKSTFSLSRLVGSFYITGGAGGAGSAATSAKGGAGGVLNLLNINSHGSEPVGSSFVKGDLKIAGGLGGNPGAGGALGVGGNGGGITNLKLNTDGVIGGEIDVNAGNGGTGGSATGNGGNAGNLSKIVAVVGGASGGVLINHYNQVFGGDGGTTGGDGGKGGNVSNIAVTNLGYLGYGSYVRSGKGGQSNGTTGNGGDAGSTSNVVITNKGGAHALGIYTQNGGAGMAAVGSGGSAGSVTNATINNFSPVGAGNIFVGGYYGGDAFLTGNGGRGGSVSHVKLNDSFGTTAGIYIYAGSGGNGQGVGGKGGDAGNLSNVFVNAPLARLNFDYNYFGNGDAGTGSNSAAGNGGLVTKLSGITGELRVFAYPGGDATNGTGGDGGDIDGVKFTVTRMANIIFAGDGGAATTGTPGKGGSVRNVSIAGDIGDFTKPFDTTIHYKDLGMGGLVAGRGGALNGVFDVSRNGSISNVSAHRIAAIVAGSEDAQSLVPGDAVLSITKIKATVIGADPNGDGMWNYIEGASNTPGFQFHNDGTDTDDSLIDGLVLVKTGGFASPPVTPLHLIEV